MADSERVDTITFVAQLPGSAQGVLKHAGGAATKFVVRRIGDAASFARWSSAGARRMDGFKGESL